MSHHRNYSDSFSDYTLPSFLDVPTFDITEKEIIIELGEGAFTLDFNILFHNHDIIIKGQGSGKTFLNVPKNIDYIDDAILNIQADHGSEINVSLSGLTIWASVLKQHAESANFKLTQNESYLIKCYNAKSFVMNDVRIWADNLATTCVDIRRGFNIDIRESEFKNFNRRWTGGNIWLRGDIENVVIEDNDFYKYGNDEVIGLYDTNNFIGVNDADEISKMNVEIRYNRFYCQDGNGGTNPSGIINETGSQGKWDGCNQRFVTFFTNQDNNKELGPNNELVQRSTPCHQTINGVHLDNNEFHINAPLSHLITVAFDKYTTFKDVTMRNNIIDYGDWKVNGSPSSWKELMDFCVYYDTIYDASVIEGDYDRFSDEPFVITGNTITCGTNMRNVHTGSAGQYYSDNHICIDLKGTKVLFNNNYINCIREAYTPDEDSFANKGIEMFHSGEKGGEIIFNNNRCEGLRCLASWSSGGNPLTICRLRGNGNYLQGNPRIIHVNVLECYEFMSDNEIVCDYPIFFLEEFANIGTAIFIGNRVYRDLSRVPRFTTAYGHIYYTGVSGSGNNIQSMKLICCDNIFDNISNSSMYSYLQSAMRTIHKNNVFVNIYE